MNTADVVVIGGGPAGSSAGAIMAEHGLRVVLIERSKFPRYHIGESLLPFTWYPLKRLGLLGRMQQSEFVKKHSVQFVSPSGKVSQPFYFASRYAPEVAQTWQVLRSEFDKMLLDNARARGVEVLEETSAKELLREGDRITGVQAVKGTGEVLDLHAPMTLDCSGRDAFSVARMNWRVAEPKLNKIAVWTYYRGAKRDPGIDAGATTVAYVPEKGWFWYIPQHRDMVSVGVVAEGKYLTRGGVRDPKDIFLREIGQNAWIQAHLSPGQQVGEHHLTGEFSFRSRYCAADGLLVAGDAFGFLDPVFSSGVLLALKSGVLAGDAISAACAAGDYTAARFSQYSATMRQAIENMRRLVYAFYDPAFSFRDLTDKHPGLAGAVTDCLSGDVNKDFSELFEAIGEITESPEPLPYGVPLTPAPELALQQWGRGRKAFAYRMAYEFRTTRRVEFSDTDMEGIMHYSNFFRFMETAEHGFLRSLGHSVVLSRSGLAVCLPRVHASCEYSAPLRFEDEVEIHLVVEKKGRRSITYQMRFSRVRPGERQEVACGRLVVVCARKGADGTMTSVALPEEISRNIEQAPAELLNNHPHPKSPKSSLLKQ